MSLDIMEGKEHQSKKDYEEFGAGPAVTLRLHKDTLVLVGLSLPTVHLLQ